VAYGKNTFLSFLYIMSESVWKDLLTWQKDINAKDEALLRRKPIHDQVSCTFLTLE
jgi:hypothetical protein